MSSTFGEFDLIARYFTRPVGERQGVGDDCALIDVGDRTLAVTCDMLIEGVHFLSGADPQDLGHKSLAVNLSDLAAAGAKPRCFVLALALPRADELWLEGYSRGIFALAQQHACALVGGDTTRAPAMKMEPGPITISITAIGEVDRASVRGRAGARAEQDIWLSGRTGEAALALDARRGRVALASDQRGECERRMDRPQPRVALGLALRGVASAAIDVSDGLVGDLGHILERSGVGAELAWSAMPVAPALAGLDEATRQRYVLAGGDDYELVFTAAPERRAEIEALARAGVPVTRIGRIERDAGLRIRDASGALVKTRLQAFDHFAATS